jgi:hypothetical protein
MTSDQIEKREAVVVANDSFTLDDAGSNRQLLDRFGDEREAVCQVGAVAAYQPKTGYWSFSECRGPF